MSKHKFDQLHRFIFNNAHIRGELVQLNESLVPLFEAQDYPQCIQHLLGEMMLATSLLTATLKFEGEISLQVQSSENLKFAVISGSHEQQLRGIARWEGSLNNESFKDLVGNKGMLAITIMPKNGQQYQGIVALDKPSLAECLKGYFEQSEQLATEIVLHTQLDGPTPLAAGMLLQAIPESDTSSQELNESFEHVALLTKTITGKELVELPVLDILHRLYHQEDLSLFNSVDVSFSCSCSRDRISQALVSISRQELQDILIEKGTISTNCQYCFTEYQFNESDIDKLFEENTEYKNELH